jgi:hypothetical protein
MSIIPRSRPQLTADHVRAFLREHGQPIDGCPVALLGVRGYFRDTLGVPGQNDFGIYDDAIFAVGPDGFFAVVNANTDPGRTGWNPGVGKPFAVLQPGVWWFRRGPHKGKTPALRQCTDEEAEEREIPNDGEFTVERSYGEGNPKNYRETGYFAINMHRGGEATTSSWGCQTIPPDQFDDFMEAVWAESKKAGQDKLPYVLISGPVS